MKKINLLVLLVLIAYVSFAQKLKNEEGDLTVLKGQDIVAIQYDYSELKLMKDNFSETEYIENRKKDLNEKNSGEGDRWEKRWNNAKEMFWQSKFEELISATATEKTNIKFVEGAEGTKYTLLVNVVWIYPGWDAGIMKQEAKVTTELNIIETANPSKVLYKIDAIEAPGDQWGSNFSNESRIGEGFAKTAKTFGKLISKELK